MNEVNNSIKYNKELLENTLLNTEIFTYKEESLIINIIPELRPMVNCSQNHPAHYLDVFSHTIKVIEYVECNIILKLVALLHDSGKPFVKTNIDGIEHFKNHNIKSVEISKIVLAKLGYEKLIIDRICTLVKYHDLPTKPTIESLNKTAAAVGPENLEYLFKIQLADMKAHEESYGNRKIEILNQVIKLFGGIEEISISKLFYQMSKEKHLNDENISVFIQNYLHYIMRISSSENLQTIERLFTCEPKIYNTIPQNVYAYIAATVEQLATELNIPAPEWINKEFYFLEEPWFPKEVLKYTKLKEVLTKVSPEPFKRRNLFVSVNAITVM